ncbi:hypothetical protein RvY_17673 [Ramazzottius varieornatus]|uniref:G-protein coupled receptors family 1 profile domain-containing protein n=1 Tax=Ramazzottius varieornatus TaxID=947166 RepID=A0A1D1W534_RAMVA|nr:hypothetical protein RvY_17673 [Ramazzottius varieornatus]
MESSTVPSDTINTIPACPEAPGVNLSLAEFSAMDEACNSYYNQTDGGGIELSINDYISIVMYIVIFIFCIVGNALVVITLMQHRRMRTVTNIFLINLSIGDLLLGVFCMPFTLSGQILKRFVFGAAMCHMILYFQVVSVGVSTFTLLSISIERFFAICRPLTSRRWQTVSHSVKMIIGCWVLALVIGLPVLFYSRHYSYLSHEGVDYYACREEYDTWELAVVYNLILLIIFFGLPGFIMCLAYLRITVTLFRGTKEQGKASSSTKAFSPTESSNGSLSKLHKKLSRLRSGSGGPSSQHIEQRNGSSSGWSRSLTIDEDEPMAVTTPSSQYSGAVRSTHTERNQEAKKKVVIMLICVVCEFFICFTPVWLINFVLLFDPKGVQENLGGAVRFFHLLMYVSTCCNPITYCFLHSKFRQSFLQAITCKKDKPEISDLLRSRTAKILAYKSRTGTNSLSSTSVNNTSSNQTLMTTCTPAQHYSGHSGQRNRLADAYL